MVRKMIEVSVLRLPCKGSRTEDGRGGIQTIAESLKYLEEEEEYIMSKYDDVAS